MKKIPSFTIDHLNLESGLYVSRKDMRENVTVTTFDMRVTAPNKEPVMDMPALHTIEHLGATFLRNSEIKDDVVYFGPMGCRTGFYIVLFGDLQSKDIYETVIKRNSNVDYDDKIQNFIEIDKIYTKTIEEFKNLDRKIEELEELLDKR